MKHFKRTLPAVLALALCVDLLCGPRILRFLLEHMFV